MGKSKPQLHHVDYKNDWIVELTGQMHRVITTIQNTNASPEQYARITNFVHSILFEWNRMRLELDTGKTMPKQRKPKIVQILDVKTRKLKKNVKINRIKKLSKS